MRIAIHDYAGFSFPLELSCEMARRGHHVLHLFSEASGGPKALNDHRQERGLQVINIGHNRINKDNLFKRWVQERQYGNHAVTQLQQWRPKVIISGNTPLEAQKKIIDWASASTVPSIFWLQDLLSVAAGSILSKISKVMGYLVFRYLCNLEIGALNKASHIVSISDDFYMYLNRWNIEHAKVSVIPNWGPIEQIPVLPRRNTFSQRHGLNDKFVVLYAGTLGKKQSTRLIAEAAAQLSADAEIRFVVATDRRGHDLLNRQIGSRRPKNLVRLPLQPTTLYPYLLASADACLVSMDRNAGSYCVPSKLWSAFCAQKASVVAVDSANYCARITAGIGAGITVPPGSVIDCVAAIRKLKTNPGLALTMGRNAREYAEQHFPIARIADTFEAILYRVSAN